MEFLKRKPVRCLLVGFFLLQALPFALLTTTHPIWALLASLPIFLLSVAALVWLLYGKHPKNAHRAEYGATVLLYFASVCWHGYIIYIGLTQGFLD